MRGVSCISILKPSKKPLDEQWINVNGVDLSVGFVPLCGQIDPSIRKLAQNIGIGHAVAEMIKVLDKPLTVRCPMCDLVMMHNGTKYFCPDCGIHD
jgi:Zn finger protein HypA/HybF involved in hydrogenase expression